jgi:heme/copper-type cytochrome/quinol oxidase subunit 3
MPGSRVITGASDKSFSSFFRRLVMRQIIEGTGFTAPNGHQLGQERHTVALTSLIATATLALSTVVVATVVSVGIARASAADSVIDNEGGLFALALLLGVLFIGMGGLTVLTLPGDRAKSHKTHDTPHHPTIA